MNVRLKKKLLYLVYLVLALELALWGLAAMSSDVELLLSNRYGEPGALADSVLGIRPNPRFAEHDEWGYRNKNVPTEVDIVAMGDSQTYGINAAREGSWPHLLADIANKHIYNLSFGTYSPPVYLTLLEQALSLKPKLILTAVYSGNDLWDAANLVYYRQTLDEFRDYVETNPQLVAAMKAGHHAAVEHSKEMTRVLEPGFSQPKQIGVDAFSLRDVLRRHSKLYGVLRLLKQKFRTDEGVQAVAGNNEIDENHWAELCDYASRRDGIFCYSSGPVRTVLAPRDRVLSEDIVEAGLEIVVDSLVSIDTLIKNSGSSHVVVLIPTKEFVYQDAIVEKIADDGSYGALIKQESHVWEEIKSSLDKFNIEYVDVLPALRTAVLREIQIYPYSTQSHPNVNGYKMIAQSIWQRLK